VNGRHRIAVIRRSGATQDRRFARPADRRRGMTARTVLTSLLNRPGVRTIETSGASGPVARITMIR
jgi:hypothetical protein